MSRLREAFRHLIGTRRQAPARNVRPLPSGSPSCASLVTMAAEVDAAKAANNRYFGAHPAVPCDNPARCSWPECGC